MCWATSLAGCSAAPPHTAAPSPNTRNASQSSSSNDTAERTAAWETERRSLFPKEDIEQPWAQRIESRLRGALVAIEQARFACFSTQCLLQVPAAVPWPTLEDKLAEVWNHEFTRVESGQRRAPGTNSALLAHEKERSENPAPSTFVRLFRHPADRSGTAEDGMPSVGLGPDNACLAGFDCDRGPLSQWTLELANETLCFTSPTEMCLCAERHDRDCPRYDY